MDEKHDHTDERTEPRHEMPRIPDPTRTSTRHTSPLPPRRPDPAPDRPEVKP